MFVIFVNLYFIVGYIKRIVKIKEDLFEEFIVLLCLYMFLFSVDWMMEMLFCMV